MRASRQTGRFAHRLGRGAGHAVRWLRRREYQAAGWLARQGLPAGATMALLWAVKLLILGVLLYAAFWAAVLVLFAIVAAWMALDVDWEDDKQPEWKEGHSGFGLYDKSEWRIDMGDPDEH